jgi:hypothetical protein
MIKFSKSVSGNTDSSTAQGFTYFKDNFPSKDSQSVLAALVSARGEDIFTRVRQIGLSLEEKFFEGEGNIPDRLKNCFKFAKEALEGAEEKNILFILWQENVLHLLSLGKNLALLSRQGKIVDLAEGAGDQVISGFITPDDTLLMINSRFIKDEALEKEFQEVLWSKEFIEKLIESPHENLADEIETFLELSQKLEPIAAVKIENSVEDIVSEENTEEEFPHIESGSSQSPYMARSQLFLPAKRAFLHLLRILPGIFKPALQDKRVRLLVLLLVVLGIILFSIFSYFRGRNSIENQRFAGLINISRQKYQDAQSFKDSNPVEAQKSLNEAKSSLEEALKVKPNDSSAKALKVEIEQNSKQILKVFEVLEFPLFLSLDLIKKDFSADKISFSLGKLLLLDKKQISLVTLDLENKTHQVLAGSQQLGQAQFAALNGDNAFAFSEDKGVVRVDAQSKKASPIVSVDPDWGKITDIFAFSGNVYLLDALKNQIWKYFPAATSYSDKNAYLKDSGNADLKEGVTADLAGGRRLKIDYSVWVQKSDEILKFTGGASDFFSVGGIDKPIESIGAIFVPEEEDRLYILDPGKSRLVVVKKNGQYDHQYIGEKFKTATDFIVDEESKKAYILESSKIYSIELK